MSKITEDLQIRGVEFEVIPHERTYTTIAEARALGISADEVLKTVVLHTKSGYALAVVPGARRLDMTLVRTATDDHDVRLATEEEMGRDFPCYELGAIPPMGSLLGLHVYVDPEVMGHKAVVFAAGSQKESVRTSPDDLFRGEHLQVLPLVRQRGEEGKDPLGQTY